MEEQELQWSCKRKQSKPLQKLYCRRFHNILSKFYVYGASMDACQLLWLLSSGKGVGYKVQIHIPDPLILKGGEVLPNEVYRVN